MKERGGGGRGVDDEGEKIEDEVQEKDDNEEEEEKNVRTERLNENEKQNLKIDWKYKMKNKQMGKLYDEKEDSIKNVKWLSQTFAIRSVQIEGIFCFLFSLAI